MLIRKRLLKHTKSLRDIDERQENLSNRFLQQYGPSSTPAPQSQYGVQFDEDEEEELQNVDDEEGDEEDEEVEAEDARDNMED